jgi:hypothetical protein
MPAALSCGEATPGCAATFEADPELSCLRSSSRTAAEAHESPRTPRMYSPPCGAQSSSRETRERHPKMSRRHGEPHQGCTHCGRARAVRAVRHPMCVERRFRRAVADSADSTSIRSHASGATLTTATSACSGGQLAQTGDGRAGRSKCRDVDSFGGCAMFERCLR